MKKQWKTALRLAVVIVAISSSGCQTIRAKTTPLPMPDEPRIVSIAANELQCLTDATYLKLLNNKLARDKYESQLEAVLQATRQ